ncbi:hypothetical protein BCR42DRAFT_422945 [Absidia repens]|uniref:Exonuclease domain-containing protein n=1 Tax=Absidia repens TaxID=90262 RepID=A0A1X2I656_9FUNG|nr:hypothetical protein BCR42DRAFT_422945 [Absidia repens]
MLPSLGLFKNIQCPALPHCKRPTCVFSHKKQQQKQQQQQQQQQQKTSSTSASSSTAKQHPTTTSSSVKRPLPARNTSDKAKLPKISSSNEGKAVRTRTPLDTSTTAQSKDPFHRVAHTPTFSGPLTIKADISSHTALKIRQVITNKLYEQYTRIYPSSNAGDPQFAAKRTQEHEQKILDTTTNTAGYKQQAMSALMELKKEAVVTEPLPSPSPPSTSSIPAAAATTTTTSVSTTSPKPQSLELRGKQQITGGGDWRSTCPILADPSYLANLVLSATQLDAMHYPPIALLDIPAPVTTTTKGKGAVQSAQQQQTCDRCKKTYFVKAILGAKDATACVYHPGRLRVSKSFGEKQRSYTCCDDPLGTTGCEKGPHVFKDENMEKMHTAIPFVTVPEGSTNAKKKERLLALDCEMGYTTIGMELIRLTVINANYEMVMDELVLPSHMVIDLNSRYSGIQTLAGVQHNLTSIRQALFDRMDQNTILLGHGLENDLKALRIIHDKVIDTSQVFPHPHGLPYRYGLRVLASKYLSKFIQEGSDGHDSFEDAATCLELVYYHHESLLKKK